MKKPMTLVNEPLSAALKHVDQGWARVIKNRSTAEFQLFGGVLVQALEALDATEKKCNPKLHRQGLQELTKIRHELNELKRNNTKDLNQYVDIKKTLRAAQDRVIAALNAFIQSPGKTRRRPSSRRTTACWPSRRRNCRTAPTSTRC
jgi:hypothetical protein